MSDNVLVAANAAGIVRGCGILASGDRMALSAVIVDDEQLARDELAYLLRDLDIDVVAQGKNGVEAVNLVK
jgi:hypothetical protein